MGEVKECIFEAIEDVPDYINETGDYLAIYEHNHLDELEEKSAELCKAIMVLFKLIMEYLNGSSESMFALYRDWLTQTLNSYRESYEGAAQRRLLRGTSRAEQERSGTPGKKDPAGSTGL